MEIYLCYEKEYQYGMDPISTDWHFSLKMTFKRMGWLHNHQIRNQAFSEICPAFCALFCAFQISSLRENSLFRISLTRKTSWNHSQPRAKTTCSVLFLCASEKHFIEVQLFPFVVHNLFLYSDMSLYFVPAQQDCSFAA